MKKTIILAVILVVSCASITRTNLGPVSVNIPSDWTPGTIGTGGNGICIMLLSKSSGNTVQTVISQMESQIDRPSQTANSNGSVTMTGMMSTPYTRKFVSVGKVTMTVRDVVVEARRLKMTDKTSTTNPLDVAKMNIRQMALILDYAQSQGLMPDTQLVDQQTNLSLEQATKSGMTKEQFLANWGISPEEFRYIISQKIAYESVLRQVTATAQNDKDYSRLATEFSNKLMTRSGYGFWDIQPEMSKVNIFDTGKVIMVVMGFGDDYDFDALVKSASLDGQFTDGQVLLAGYSDK